MRFDINETLVSNLIKTQFPQWKGLPICAIPNNGWDNKTFRLGKKLLIRMPSAEMYAAQIEKEQRWLPILAPKLPFAIPKPIAMGKPTAAFPFNWSIYHWIEGKTLDSILPTIDLNDLAISLAKFLQSLQKIDSTGGPLPGTHNFFRGGALSVYDTEIRNAISFLKNKIQTSLATEVWDTGLATCWEKPPVWVHGDISANNLLTQNGKLSAVIDFGMLAIGDPACDLVISFNLFKGTSRKIFHSELRFDKGTWARARAWALWKACIIAAKITKTNTLTTPQALHTIAEVLADHTNKNA